MKASIKKFIIFGSFFLSIMLLVIFSFSSVSNNNLNVTDNANQKMESNLINEDDDQLVYAIVIVKAMSGHSYVEDRDYIATMPELKTTAEMKEFLLLYKPSPSDQSLVRNNLEEAGLNIIGQDTVFITVSGNYSDFMRIFPFIEYSVDSIRKTQNLVYKGEDIFGEIDDIDLIDGLILFPTNNSNLDTASLPCIENSSNDETESDTTLTYSNYDYETLLNALNFDTVHSMGLTGKGIKIGFIDNGVMAGHKFFIDHPVDMKYYRFVNGQVTQVGNNFNPGLIDPDTSFDVHTNHGTAVASYLAVTAPDATLLSFATPTYYWELDNPINYISGYLSYMNEYNLVDVLSISLAINEETENLEPFLSEIRTGFIDLIANGTIVVVCSGNIDPYSGSGHNAFAAIPEVISVGGSELTRSGSSGFLFSASSRASSFSSDLFPGQSVPDIVSVFGNLKVPDLDNAYSYEAGTSFSTPQIAGLIALLKQQNPELSQSQVKAILSNNAYDITTGVNSDGYTAKEGYDLPTGFGQPIANWVIQETQTLQPGLNLIGITKDYPYTAVSLLNEISEQGGDCYFITRWDTSAQMYDGVVVIGGEVYGFDFDIEPNTGYWVKCTSKSFWTQSGTSYISEEIPINFVQGWNIISIPYSTAPCTVGELNYETNDICWRILDYNGQFNEFQSLLRQYGYNYTLSPGKGYMVLCDDDVTWTPTCTDDRADTYQNNNNPLLNYFQSNSENTFEQVITEYQNDNVSVEAQFISSGIEDLQLVGSDTSRAENVGEGTITGENCSPYDVYVSNVSDKSFTISWRTFQPCMGSIYITQDNNTYSRSFDDRGYRFSGLTHHITTQGFESETEYSVIIASGDTLYGYYIVQTGKILDQASTKYSAAGEIFNSEQNIVTDSMVYFQLWNDSEMSSLLSFPFGTITEGYVMNLGNARNESYSSYYDHSSTVRLILFVESGILFAADHIDVDLDQDPFVAVSDKILGNIPNTPIKLSPSSTISTGQVNFSFTSEGNASEEILFRLEISKDNFSSIEYVFDQRYDLTGWSSFSYSPGEIASFTPQISFENYSAYQWRVYAYYPESGVWSSSSEIVTFTVFKFETFIPYIKK